MSFPHFEPLIGVVDGVNTTFYTSVPYRPLSTAVFLNGQLKRADFEDGWSEVDPAAGRIDLKEAPLSTAYTDVLQAFFLDTTPDFDTGANEVCDVVGVIASDDDILAEFESEYEFFGEVTTDTDISGDLIVDLDLSGIISSEDNLVGIWSICNA